MFATVTVSRAVGRQEYGWFTLGSEYGYHHPTPDISVKDGHVNRYIVRYRGRPFIIERNFRW
ncbi:MAG TPA: hypothetical protein PK448_04815 [Bacteroidales bacterium]|nr:hypothetical protein [Bacteroidales bacterium]